MREIGEVARTSTLDIDLRICTVRLPDGRELAFEVPTEECKMLLEGLDAIGVTKQKVCEILTFSRDRKLRPWI